MPKGRLSTRRGKVVRTRKAAPGYTWCPRTANRTDRCFALCVPVAGRGECGRVAGHAILGRTQLAILGRTQLAIIEARRRSRSVVREVQEG